MNMKFHPNRYRSTKKLCEKHVAYLCSRLLASYFSVDRSQPSALCLTNIISVVDICLDFMIILFR